MKIFKHKKKVDKKKLPFDLRLFIVCEDSFGLGYVLSSRLILRQNDVISPIYNSNITTRYHFLALMSPTLIPRTLDLTDLGSQSDAVVIKDCFKFKSVREQKLALVKLNRYSNMNRSRLKSYFIKDCFYVDFHMFILP